MTEASISPSDDGTGVVPVAERPAPRGGRPSISCVVPCHNEAGNLDRLLPRLETVLARLSDRWEIVLVDDGSTDGTLALLEHWSRRPGFRAVELSRNFGKEAALTAGLSETRGQVVVMMDADLQHAPELITEMFARWTTGADIVYTVRTSRDDEGLFKRASTRLFYALIAGTKRFSIPPGAGDFRLLDRAVVDALLALPERNRFMKGLYAWVGFNTSAIPYQPEPRGAGKTSFNYLRLLSLSLDAITAFTHWPLRAVSFSGIVIALASITYGGYIVAEYLMYGNPVSGWTTLSVTLLVSVGLQLFSLGVVGEYVGRVFEEVKGRPIYLVRRRLGEGLPEPAARARGDDPPSGGPAGAG